MTVGAPRTLLRGWGRTHPTAATVVRDIDAIRVGATGGDVLDGDAIGGTGPRGLIARGLGRSYGDAATNAGGTVVVLADRSGAGRSRAGRSGTGGSAGERIAIADDGQAVVDGGVAIGELLEVAVPLGWFVPVTPGTRSVTIGGAIAADVHGKNHHVDGSFGDHVDWLDLWTPDGCTRRLSPHEDAEAFWATVGGMGLTGIVTRAALRLQAIDSAWMTVRTTRGRNLSEVMALLAEGQREHRFSVAWIDMVSRGRDTLGRGVVSQGEVAPAADVPAGAERYRVHPARTIPAPPLPTGTVNRLATRCFNELWYRRHPVDATGIEHYGGFFHPLDAVADWNRVYGRSGFVQWQCVVPFGAEDVIEAVVAAVARHGLPSSLVVLKTFGPASKGHLSFPAPGWTLAVDLPTTARGLAEVLDDLDRRVVAAGGRIYLAKDARMDPGHLPAMYPRLDEWRAVRDRLDPDRRLHSDLARRLSLIVDRPVPAR